MEWTDWHERHSDKIELIPGVDCWVWTGATGGGGYGRVKYGPSSEFAHRAAFIEAGSRRPNGIVRHLCGNRMCVRPGHLAEGSYADNAKDTAEMFMTGHGRLVEAYVLAVRKRYAEGVKIKDIAYEFGVPFGTVYPIVCGKSYRHVKDGILSAQRSPRKLTSETAAMIKSAALSGAMTQKEIAIKFGVKQSVVSRIKNGVRWGSIAGECNG